MSRTETVANVEARIRELGELREVYVSPAAMLFEINASYAELHDKLAAANNDLFESIRLYDVVSGTDEYLLPLDFYKCTGVDTKRNDGTWCTLESYERPERNFDNTYKSLSREWSRYRCRGNKLILVPAPTWSQTEGMKLLYIPSAKRMTVTTDTLDGINGWEDWIVYDCLIKFIGGKEDGDARVWQASLERLNARIVTMAKSRDRAEPGRIRDVEEEAAERIWPRHGAPP